MLLALWLALIVSAFLSTYFYAETRGTICRLLPLEFQPADISPFHVHSHAFSAAIPPGIQRKYFLHEVFSALAIVSIALLFAAYSQYIPLALFGAVSVYQLWILFRDFRLLSSASAAQVANSRN